MEKVSVYGIVQTKGPAEPERVALSSKYAFRTATSSPNRLIRTVTTTRHPRS